MNPHTPPRWHDTDEDAVAVPVRDTSTCVRLQTPSLSVPARRTPAAVIGILLMATIAITMTQSWTMLMLPGQTTVNHQPHILLTSSGAIPASISVTAGQQVLFRNESHVPQILSFETLRGEDGQPIQTSAIFPLSDARISIPATIPPGEYPYYSSTLSNISGVIVVMPAGQTASASFTNTTLSSAAGVLQSSNASSSVAIQEMPAMPTQPVASSAATMQPVTPHTNIPSNPYVIGSQDNHVTVIPYTATASPAITAHMPYTTTETGSAAWASVIIFGISLLFVWRRAEA